MREIRSSGSAEGVMGNCDPYSDSPKPAVVRQPQFTRVEEPTLLCNHVVRVGEILTKQERDSRSLVRYFCHMVKPPRKAFSLLPSRVPGGRFFNFLEFPPPNTT